MVASITTSFLAASELEMVEGDRVGFVAVLVILTIVLGGLFQIVLGLLGGGKLIKFIPYPVTAGFINGTALIILLGQIKPFLGLAKSSPLSSLFESPPSVWVVALAIGVITMMGMLLMLRVSRAIPAPLGGLALGVIAYFVIAFFFHQPLLSLTSNSLLLGPMPESVPTPRGFLSLVQLIPRTSPEHLSLVFVPSVMLGLLGAINSLLTSVRTDVMTGTRHDSKRELIGQGIGNVCSGLFNGIAAAGNPVCSAVSIRNGGRTWLAAVTHSVTILVVILVLSKAVQWVPVSALAAVLIMTAFQMVDKRSLGMVRSTASRTDFSIVAIVTVTTAVMGLITGVALGLLISFVIFVKRLALKSIIKRKYYGNDVHSKKIRLSSARKVLEEHGDQIVVYELEGSLFFGTCEQLTNEIESHLETTTCLILDLKRVQSIDITAIQLIRHLAERLNSGGKHLMLGYLDANSDRRGIWKELEAAGLIYQIGADNVFAETDLALESAEDNLIRRCLHRDVDKTQVVKMQEMEIFRGFSSDELKQAKPFFGSCSYKKGEIIFREEDPGETMYLITSGQVSIHLQINGQPRTKRITTFGSGTFFGEMAFLEGKNRSATARAETDTRLIALTMADFRCFKEKHTEPAAKMLLNMLREISTRLRMTSREVRVLEE